MNFIRNIFRKKYSPREEIISMLENEYGYKHIDSCSSGGGLIPSCTCDFFQDNEDGLFLVGKMYVLSSNYPLLKKEKRFTDICMYKNCPEKERIRSNQNLSRVLDTVFYGATNAYVLLELKENLNPRQSSPSSAEGF